MTKDPSSDFADSEGWMVRIGRKKRPVLPESKDNTIKGRNHIPEEGQIRLYPKRHFWCGFDSKGKERWFIELNNGRIVSDNDENYKFWLKKYQRVNYRS